MSTPTIADLAGTWTLDTAGTEITFRTKAMWLVPVKGTATATGGGATLTPEGQLTGSLVIDAASIDTKVAKRDEHLRTADFLDVATYPTLTFTATSVRVAGTGVEIDGIFEAHGQTAPLTVTAQVEQDGDAIVIAGTTAVDRSQWGISATPMGASVHNQVSVRARFVRA